MGDATQPPTNGDHPTTVDAHVALLELTPADARTLALAHGMGDISLALRGVEAETVGMRTGSSAADTGALSQQATTVRIHAFGTVTGGGR
jgi:Flp pilus assembly protein CpaB